MALKFFPSKPPSVETISTSLTYIALTGVILAPLATARPVLPEAVEARAQAAPSDPVRAVPAPPGDVARATAPVDQQSIAGTEIVAASLTATPDALQALPPAKQLSEARSRLKSVRAKEAKQNSIETVPAVATEAAAPPPAVEPPITLAKADKAKAGRAAEARKTPTVESEAPKSAIKSDNAKPDNANAEPAKKEPAADDIPSPATTVPTAWTDAEIATALKECLRLLAPVNAEVEVNPSMRKGECGTPAPILLKSIGSSPKITFQPAVEINCPMAVALGEWATDTLQPAARDSYGSEVSRIVGSSGYSCRNRYGLASERLSEHALANAIDIGGFTLANGKTIKVTQGWGATQRDVVAAAKENDKAAKENDKNAAKKADEKPSKTPTIKSDAVPTQAALKPGDAKGGKKDVAIPEKVAPVKISEADGASATDGKFLRRLHKGACETFGTVLGPEANEAHRDHFHFDLKARKRRAVCQ